MKNNYKTLLRRPEWKAKAKQVKEAAGNVCQECGSGRNLQVHHQTYVKGRMPWEYDDLRCLCAKCHYRKHYRPKNLTPPTFSAIIGKFFHSFNDDGHVEWQGRVIGKTEGEFYLVQLYSWMSCDNTNCRLVAFEDMLDWYFYNDHDEMKYSYQDGVASIHRNGRSTAHLMTPE